MGFEMRGERREEGIRRLRVKNEEQRMKSEA